MTYALTMLMLTVDMQSAGENTILKDSIRDTDKGQKLNDIQLSNYKGKTIRQLYGNYEEDFKKLYAKKFEK